MTHTDSTQDALRLEQLVLARGGKPVLHGVSLCIARGEITALLGANGAGKSSTVMALAGVLPLTSGRVLLGGVPLALARPEHVRAQGIAVVPEGHRVLGALSVHDNLRVACAHLPARAQRTTLEATLALLPELEPKLTTPGHLLSGGQKQMVCIAQALLAQPRYLAIDELSLGLAPTVVQRLAGVVQDVARRGVGVLLIEQFTTVALALASRAYVLERGRVAFEGSAAELRARPEVLHSSYLAAEG